MMGNFLYTSLAYRLPQKLMRNQSGVYWARNRPERTFPPSGIELGSPELQADTLRIKKKGMPTAQGLWECLSAILGHDMAFSSNEDWFLWVSVLVEYLLQSIFCFGSVSSESMGRYVAYGFSHLRPYLHRVHHCHDGYFYIHIWHVAFLRNSWGINLEYTGQETHPKELCPL